MVKKVFFIIAIVIVILSTNIIATFAATKNELEQEGKDLQNKINETEDDLEEVKEELSETMEQISELTEEISEYEDEIEDLEGQIEDLEKDIEESEEKLKEAESNYNDQQKKLEERLVTLYELGETSFLDVLLTSKDITEFITNYYLVEEIAEYDTELLDQMEKNKNEIANAKKTLEDNKEKVEALKSSKVATTQALKKSQATKQDHVDNLSEDEKELQKQLDQFEKDKEEIEDKLAELARQEANSGGTQVVQGTPSSYGYIFPVQGLNIYNINNRSYPSYSGHTGVDVNINVKGKNVVAVKSGTVVISTALTGSIRNYDSNGNYIGSYRSYGEYIVINHHDGTMTLYAHMKPGSRKVSVGDKVVQGQVIGVVGNTGNVLPRPSSSYPNSGTHLHFEVRINGRCVNPIPYL